MTNVGLDQANHDGNVQGLADLIFSQYVFAFEVVSALLVMAAMGAMILAHRERQEPRTTQGELSRQRFRGGQHPAPLPGPGVYARHNAVDTPALLPDGTPADVSVSRVLQRPRATSGTSPAPSSELAVREEEAPMNPMNYVYLSAVLFSIGAAGVLLRRNAIVVFMCVELMLNATNLAFVTFSRMKGNLDGQVIAFFVMVVAAAEVVVGLAIIVTIFRTRRSASVDGANLLKY